MKMRELVLWIIIGVVVLMASHTDHEQSGRILELENRIQRLSDAQHALIDAVDLLEDYQIEYEEQIP